MMKEDGVERARLNYVFRQKGRSLSAITNVVRDRKETFQRLHETVDIAAIIKVGTIWADQTFIIFQSL
jgi:hypothetical protein